MGFLKANDNELHKVILKKPCCADLICSSYIDFNNPKYVDIDEIYYSSLLIINYSREMETLFLNKILSLDVDVQISMYYDKQNSYDVIRELTYSIGNTGANIKTSGENEQDIDIVANVYTDAKLIRKSLQLGEEDLFYITVQIGVFSKDAISLEQDLERVESVIATAGLTSIRANFRQESAIKSLMPFNDLDNDIKEITSRNVLTSGLSASYPFSSDELFDKNGILIGTNSFDKSLLMLDRFDTAKYKNANIFVVGTSGSGKSYFVKLMINRNRFLNITQFVIDPDREYQKLCQNLNGTLINFGASQVINVFDIRETILEDGESFLLNKISKLKTFFSLIFTNMSEDDKAMLEEKLIDVYKKVGITEDNSSLYMINEKSKLIKNKKFKTSEMMPRLEDLYNLLKKDKKLKKYASVLKPMITGSLKFLNNYTNIDFCNKLVIMDVHDVSEEELPIIMFIATEYFWDLIKNDRTEKKVLYLDEAWKLINKNEYTADFVFKLFKTIRKYGGAATCITQDISDFFMLEDGKYGKGILNNSSIKCLFQLEETDLNILEKVMNISEEEKYKLLNIKRGSSIIHADRNVIMADIISSSKEHELITTDRKDLEKYLKDA